MFDYNMHEKEVISNIIGLNPTGTLSFNGTFAMNGSNNNVNTQEFALKEQENISTADICMELFEGENIVVGKTDNGQSQLISGPFAKKDSMEQVD